MKEMVSKEIIVKRGTSGKVVFTNKRGLWKGRPEKSLSIALKNTGGRNNLGRQTCRTKCSVGRRIYRQVDFKRIKDNVFATVERLEYDPNRSAFIALIRYEDGELSYVLATDKMIVGKKIVSGNGVETLDGNCSTLGNISLGSEIHNIEVMAGFGGKLVRSAGSSAILQGKENGKAIVKMPSGETRKFPLECRATVGVLSNKGHFNVVLGKAGRSKRLGIRSINRGIARNPVDHPNGGRTHGGKIFANVTGRVIKGKKTRKKKFSDSLIIRRKVFNKRK